MSSRSKYKTKQRELLLGYFETVPGIHLTASDICDHFRSQDAPISQSTVYRHLESLVDEGIIRKYTIDGSSPACFEYEDPCSHDDTEVSFHCKCERCGRLIHLHCEELNDIRAHLMREHDFKLDPLRTVLYGLCEQCMSSEQSD
ncbi:MAG: transcriptional repressor [Clostridia bacterium]|nr:transcriptional repressor [Clostridia bacterium]